MRIVIALILLTTTAQAQSSGVHMTVPCQQNLDDARILVDGRFVPTDIRYRVLSIKPERAENGWSYGTCTIVSTGRLRS